jgi:hypothetical protein
LPRRLPNKALQQTSLSVASLPLAPAAERRYVSQSRIPPEVKFDDAAWTRWRGWIDTIRIDMSRTRNDAAIFSDFRRLVIENQDWIAQHKGLRFCHFVFRSYVTSAALGVRRHVKKKDDAISMARLISQMQLCPDQITLKFYRSRFPSDPNDIDWQPVCFRRLSDDGTVVSSRILQSDALELKRLSTTIEKYADRVLAHLDAKGSTDVFTFDDLDKAVRNFDELVCRYEGFLTGSSAPTLEAVVQDRWEQIFDVPLRKPG